MLLSFNAKRQLENIKTGSCGGPTVMGLGYDDNGNLVKRNGLLKLDFDHGNRLREVYNGPPENRNVIERYGMDGKLCRLRTAFSNSWAGKLPSCRFQSGNCR